MSNESSNMAAEVESTPQTTASDLATPQKGGNKTVLIVVVVLVLLLLIGAVVAFFFLRNQNSTLTGANIPVGRELTREEQVAFFSDISSGFFNENQSMKFMVTSDNGDTYTYINDAANGITMTAGSFSGTALDSYTTADKSYLKMEGKWYYMDKTVESDTEAEIEEDITSDVADDFSTVEEEDFDTRIFYRGVVDCPGEFKGQCHKFEMEDESGNMDEVYFNGNKQIVHMVDVEVSGTSRSDFLYENITVTLPDEVKNAPSYEQYVEDLINSGTSLTGEDPYFNDTPDDIPVEDYDY